MSSEALATVKGVQSLVFDGKTRMSDIAEVLQGATVARTIEGASTLTLELYDDDRALLRSGIFDERVTVRVDAYRFELAQVRKSGPNLTVVFEDLPVAALRRHTSPLKVAPGTTTHVDFAERLVKEEAWLKFWTPDELRSGERTKVEIARGTPGGTGDEEDSWTALGRIADERGWRRFLLNNTTLAYVPETYLIEQDTAFVVNENRNGVDDVDFDFDIGKPVATLKLTVRAARWSVPVGSVVEVKDLGPATGKWIVSSISRSLFSIQMDITLTKPRPTLPEPEAAAVAAVSSGVSGGSSSAGIGAAAGAIALQSSWPDDPQNLVKIGQGNHRLAEPAAVSFARVQERYGRQIIITDSYRSVATQRRGYASDPSRFGRPGNSAHGEGRAVDVNLKALGLNLAGEPGDWMKDAEYRALVEAFVAEGWCNYQIRNGTASGRTREPWHFSYQVCK